MFYIVPMNNAIQVDSLSKAYGEHRVLHGITFGVGVGRLVGFLGPNGAGKTTTIRILLGLISASSGSAQIFGSQCDAHGPKIRHDVGYLPGEPKFYNDLTGQATLDFFAGARRRNCAAEIQRLASVFELDLARTVRKYSSGMKQKLGLMQALMHKPRLLVLDEPTSALDPLVRQTLFAELRSVASDNRTVLFSSHTLGEVEELCDDVVILREGRIVEQQTIAKLRERSLRRVTVKYKADAELPTTMPAAFSFHEAMDGSVTGTWSADVSGLLQWLTQQPIDDVSIEQADLEDLFLSYYTDATGPSGLRKGGADP